MLKNGRLFRYGPARLLLFTEPSIKLSVIEVRVVYGKQSICM